MKVKILKPNSDLPEINVDKIYTANGAAERGRFLEDLIQTIN